MKTTAPVCDHCGGALGDDHLEVYGSICSADGLIAGDVSYEPQTKRYCRGCLLALIGGRTFPVMI